MTGSERWRDSNGDPLKFQCGDYIRIVGREPSPFSEGYVRAYSEKGDGITYSISLNNVHTRGLREDDLELAPDRRVTYSAVGFTEDGNNVNVWMWGDWMDIRAEGFETAEEAEAHAPTLFGQDERVAFVSISESVQDSPGGGWHSGRAVARVERPKN